MSTIFSPPPSVEQLLLSLPYTFTSPRYLVEALRAAGSGYNISSKPTSVDGHKRLAQVRNAVMRTAVLCEWYVSGAKRGGWSHKSLSLRKANSLAVASQYVDQIGSAEVLSECGHRIGLQDCISVNPSQCFEPPSKAIIARAVQAVVGAVWLDSQENMEDVRRVLQTLGLLAQSVEG